jgi:hypothetical protein
MYSSQELVEANSPVPRFASRFADANLRLLRTLEPPRSKRDGHRLFMAATFPGSRTQSARCQQRRAGISQDAADLLRYPTCKRLRALLAQSELPTSLGGACGVRVRA